MARRDARRGANTQLEVTHEPCVDLLSNSELSGDSTEESMATDARLPVGHIGSIPQQAEADAAAAAETGEVASFNALDGGGDRESSEGGDEEVDGRPAKVAKTSVAIDVLERCRLARDIEAKMAMDEARLKMHSKMCPFLWNMFCKPIKNGCTIYRLDGCGAGDEGEETQMGL